MNKTVWILIILAGVTALDAQSAPPEVSVKTIREVMSVLTGVKSFTRANGKKARIVERKSSSQRALAREYLKSVYVGAGFDVIQKKAGRTKAINLLARSGKGNETLLIGAHLDNVGNAGANDDASGIATEVAVAIAYARRNPPIPLTVAAWDLEEDQFVGSWAAKKVVKGWNVKMALNMDMVGRNYAQPRELMVSVCNKPGGRKLFKQLLEVMNDISSPLQGYSQCFGRSDHESLWEVGIPTLHLEGGLPEKDPCYHEKCDTLENVDFSYMKNVGDAALNLLLRQNETR
jgi:Zn-dependent M28 family amino/carboxypeptidase